MSVRAKFKVDSKVEHFYSGQVMVSVNMTPVGPKWIDGVTIPDHENSKFWSASPSGEFKLGTVNKDAAAELELGKEYYLDISPAE